MSSKSYVVNSGQLFFHQTLRKRIEARTSHQFEHTVYKQLRTKGQCRLFVCFVYVGSLATLFFLTQESILLSLENLPEGSRKISVRIGLKIREPLRKKTSEL